jgi:hypothetical protein
VPVIVAVDRGGVIRYLHAEHDFADRPGGDELSGTGAREVNGAVEIRISAEEADTSTLRPARPPITLKQLAPYYRGVFFVTVALKRRFDELKNRAAFKEVNNYQQMAKEYAAAINETRDLKDGS